MAHHSQLYNCCDCLFPYVGATHAILIALLSTHLSSPQHSLLNGDSLLSVGIDLPESLFGATHHILKQVLLKSVKSVHNLTALGESTSHCYMGYK